MKIILSKDIKNLGRKGEIKEVSAGYAMNYLIPEQLATVFKTTAAIKPVKTKKSVKKSK